MPIPKSISDRMCMTCGKILESKATLRVHIRTVHGTISDGKKIPPVRYKCIHCKKTFTRKDSRTRHQRNTCKQIINADVNNNKNCAINIGNTTTNVNDNSTNDNSTNDNSTNIQLVVFGTDDIDDLTDDEIKFIAKTTRNPLGKLVELTNLNPDRPQYHNILITNIRSPKCKIYTKDGWKDEVSSKVIKTLVFSKAANLKKIRDTKVFLSRNKVRHIQRTLYGLGIKQDDDSEHILSSEDLAKIPTNIEKFDKFLRPRFYVARDMVKETKWAHEEQHGA